MPRNSPEPAGRDPAPDEARTRFLLIALVRLLAAGGAFLGVWLIARAPGWPIKALGIAEVLAAIYFGGVIPLWLARRWRSPR